MNLFSFFTKKNAGAGEMFTGVRPGKDWGAWLHPRSSALLHKHSANTPPCSTMHYAECYNDWGALLYSTSTSPYSTILHSLTGDFNTAANSNCTTATTLTQGTDLF